MRSGGIISSNHRVFPLLWNNFKYMFLIINYGKNGFTTVVSVIPPAICQTFL